MKQPKEKIMKVSQSASQSEIGLGLGLKSECEREREKERKCSLVSCSALNEETLEPFFTLVIGHVECQITADAISCQTPERKRQSYFSGDS